MEDSQQNIQSKQEYLRMEVIEKGYNPYLFAEFLQKAKKIDIQNIGSLSIQVLGKIILQFQTNPKFNSKEQQEQACPAMGQFEQKVGLSQSEKFQQVLMQESVNKEILQQQMQQKLREEQECQQQKQIIVMVKDECSNDRRMILDFESVRWFNQESIIYDINSKKNRIGKLNNLPNPIYDQIKITHFQVINEGLFTRNYLAVKITTSPLSSSVWRRVSDFKWLKQTIGTSNLSGRLYPSQFLNPIPKGKILEVADIVLLSKKKKVYQDFLNGILNNPILRNTCLFQDYLSFDQKKWKDKKKEYQKQAAPSKPEQFVLPFSPYKIEMGKNVLDGLKQYSRLSKSSFTLLDMMKQLGKKLKNQIEQIVQTYKQIIQCTQIIWKNCKQSNQKMENRYKLKQFENEILNFKAGLNNIKNIYIVQSKSIQANFIYPIHSLKKTYQKYLSFLDYPFQLYQSYKTSKQFLYKKKIQNYQKGHQNWQIPKQWKKQSKSLPRDVIIDLLYYKESQQIKKFEGRVGIFMKRASEQCKRSIDQTNWKGMIQNLYQNIAYAANHI